MSEADEDAAPADSQPQSVARERMRRELRYFAIVGGFGVIALPFFVYLAGALTLGPYEGGLLSFLGKLYGDLLRLSPAAIALLFGPYLLFQGLRLLTRPLRQRWLQGRSGS
jgi:hypothetical protein